MTVADMTNKTKGRPDVLPGAHKENSDANSTGAAQRAAAVVCTLAIWGLLPFGLAERLAGMLRGARK